MGGETETEKELIGGAIFKLVVTVVREKNQQRKREKQRGGIGRGKIFPRTEKGRGREKKIIPRENCGMELRKRVCTVRKS